MKMACVLFQQFMFQRDRHCLRAIGGGKLAEDVTDMGLDCGAADDQALGDIGVGETLYHQGQHFQFTAGEVGHRGIRQGGRCRDGPVLPSLRG